MIRNNKVEQLINDQLLLDSLDRTNNSISNGVLNNRSFLIRETLDWRYIGHYKNFQLDAHVQVPIW